jgi:acetyltransferase-like isoleucine patch superfamily enzyme
MTKILNVFYSIARFFGWICHFFYTHRVHYFFYRISREFTTQLYKRNFKSFGKGSIIASPTLLKAPKQISVGSSCTLNEGLLLRCYGENSSIIIGDGSAIGAQSSISCCNKITIGNGVRTGRMVIITDNSHGNNDSRLELDNNPILRPIVSKGEVIIDDNVWIGEKASIMPGVHIGKGVIIGSNAVVTKDIPPYSIAVGCPAKVIKTIEK